jgi:hypothetical protein
MYHDDYLGKLEKAKKNCISASSHIICHDFAPRCENEKLVPNV